MDSSSIFRILAPESQFTKIYRTTVARISAGPKAATNDR
jgi:hypothetical protein